MEESSIAALKCGKAHRLIDTEKYNGHELLKAQFAVKPGTEPLRVLQKIRVTDSLQCFVSDGLDISIVSSVYMSKNK